MANSDKSGFITLHRKIIESPVFEDPKILKVWVWCLLRANWKQTVVFFGKEEITVKRGQFIFGRFTGSGQCNMTPSTFYRILKKLENAGMIAIKANNKKSLLTVIKYESYQSGELELEQQTNNKRTTNEQQTDTDNKGTSKQGNKEHIPADVQSVISYGVEIELSKEECERFFDYFTSNGWKVGGKTAMKDWKASLRNWKRNKEKFGGKGAGTFGTHRQSDATARATYQKSPEQIAKDVRATEESIRLLRQQRS